MQRLRSQIYDLSVLYVRNMSDDSNFLLFSETELVGLPPEFLQVEQVLRLFFAITYLLLLSLFFPIINYSLLPFKDFI